MSRHPGIDREGPRRFPWLPCLLVFVVALAARAVFLALMPDDAIRPSGDWELDAIAISLVTEGRYADPYIEPTGPTAHLPPVPPLLLALTYQVFGITMLAGFVAWLTRMLCQAVLWGLLPWIGERLGVGWRAGLLAGLAGALYPRWMAHGESVAALGMGLLTVAVARRWDGLRGGHPGAATASSILLGAAFGVSFHVQPVLLPVLLGYLGFEVWSRSDGARWRSAGFVLLGALLVSLPWGLRNYRALDAVFFVRSNLGLELRMGNHEGATADIDDPHFRGWPHPRTHASETAKIRQWGEVAYMRDSGRQAVEWIAAHPADFMRLTAARVRYFWLGPLDHPATGLLFVTLAGMAALGAVRVLRELDAHRSAVLLIPLLTYPWIYYLVPWQHRYRFPIEWILLLLAGTALSWWAAEGPRGTLRGASGAPPTG